MIRQRLTRLREKVAAEKLDAFLVNRSIRYFGLPSGSLLVPLDGAPIVLSGRIDFELLKGSPFKEIRVFCEAEVPTRKEEKPFIGEFWKFLLSILQEMGIRRIGMEKVSLTLLRKLGAEGIDCLELPLVEELRMIKSREEIEILKKSAKIASEGMKVAAQLIEPGRTEREIAAEAEYTMRKLGSDGTPFPTIVASGPNSWIPHASSTDRVLQRGEHVIVDLGATYKGYASDMTRTFRVKKGDSGLIKKVRNVQKEIMKEVREGVKACELDSLARKKLGRDAKFFVHGLGHGVGLEIHERPSLSPSSKDVLQAGMVITIEPGLYLPGKGGARWEDMVIVKKEGCEVITT